MTEALKMRIEGLEAAAQSSLKHAQYCLKELADIRRRLREEGYEAGNNVVEFRRGGNVGHGLDG